MYKLNHRLFRQSTTRNADECYLNECQYTCADDAGLLATTRAGAVQVFASYIEVTAEFDLTVNLPKTKLLVAGHVMQEEDKAPIHLDHCSIDCVDN